MARGLNNTWGDRTELDPNRSVTRVAMPQGLASRLHYGGTSAEQLYQMPEEEWEGLSKGGLVNRDDVANYLRAYEHYDY